MRLTLTSEGLARLGEATRTLLSPLAAPDPSAWRHDAMRAVSAAIGAETACFTFPGQPRVVETFGLDGSVADAIDTYTADTWSGRGGSPEPLLDEFYRRAVDQRIEAWDMPWADHVLGGCGAAWANQFYDEVLAPNGLGDTQALFLPSARGSVMLTAHHLRRPAAPGEHLPILGLLVPAFRAGLETLARYDAQRTALDVLDEPLVVFDADGREVHRNPALGALLAADAEADRVLGGLRAHARALRSRGPEPPDGGPLADRVVKTHTRTYRLRGTLLAASTFGPDGAVMLSVRTEGPPALPSSETLRERYGLTRREAEAALLLAEGLSNDALADRLVISPHTARHHTEQVLGKLGLPSRKALALHLLRPDSGLGAPSGARF